MPRVKDVSPSRPWCTLGIDFGTTSCRASFVQVKNTDRVFPVGCGRSYYRNDYAGTKHTPHEIPTVGAILPNGELVVGDAAYEYRDNGSSNFVQLKPAVYIVSGVEIDAEMQQYEPLKALLSHIGQHDVRMRLRELVVAFFQLLKKQVDEVVQRKNIDYKTIAITIPNCWAKPNTKALQSTYEGIIAEVWPGKTIEVLFEVEALGHYLLGHQMAELQNFSRLIVIDSGGHTLSVQCFEPFWNPKDPESPPTFTSISKGESKFAGGECWEHSLINRVIPKLDAQGIFDLNERKQILRDIRRALNEGKAGAAPWEKDAILTPGTHHSTTRILLEKAIIKECFEIAFNPALNTIKAVIQDEGQKGTLILLYGGSTHHEFFCNEIAKVARVFAKVTTELVAFNGANDYHEKIDRGSASTRTKKYKERHRREVPEDPSGKRRPGRPRGLPVQCTLRMATSWITEDDGGYKSVISTGAAIAVSQEMTAEKFLRRGAAIGVNLHPNDTVHIVLSHFDQEERRIRGSLRRYVVPDTVTDTPLNTETSDSGGGDSVATVGSSDEFSEEEAYKLVRTCASGGRKRKRRATRRMVPKEVQRHNVMLVCAPMEPPTAPSCTTSAQHTYDLFHLQGLEKGTYDIEMCCDMATMRLSVGCFGHDDGRTWERRWELELYFDIGSICIMAEDLSGSQD